MREIAPLMVMLALPAFAEFAEVNGLKLYYEVHGKGRTVVLLHGGMNTIQTSFAKQIPVLARNHRVIAIEQMAHGHTPDVAGRPLSYEGMTEDTAALLAHLGVRNADLVGWSDSGQLALRLAFMHPHLVRRVFVSGVGLGATPEVVKELGAEKDFPALAACMVPAGFEDYRRVSPDGPGHWSVYAEKGRVMWSRSTWGFQEADLARISVPVLVAAGDKDLTDLAETARIFRAIPKAKLYVLPGTGHTTFQDRPDWLNAVLLDFLDRD